MYTLTEDTTFQPADARIVCSDMLQTIPGSQGTDVEQWIRFTRYDENPILGYSCTVWATRAAAIGVPPYHLIGLLFGAPPRDMDSPSVRAEMALWPDFLGLYGYPLMTGPGGTIAFSANPLREDTDISGYQMSVVCESDPPINWPGCVWHYGAQRGYSSANTILDSIVAILTAHTGSGQSLDGISEVTRGAGAEPFGPPRLEVSADAFTLEQNAEIVGADTIWTGGLGVTVTLLMSQAGPWWRDAVYYLSAVRTILADEFASGVSGAWRLLLDGGQNPRAGAGSVHFVALVRGQFEIVSS